jgi:hypothetical protein
MKKNEFNMANSTDVFCVRCEINLNNPVKRLKRECQVCAKVLCSSCEKKFYQVHVEKSGEWSNKWFFFCDVCFPGKNAYKLYNPKASTPSNTNNNKNDQDVVKTPIKRLEIISNNDSGYFPESPINPNNQLVMKILEKITKQCEDIKEELNTYRKTSQQEISDLKANVKRMTKSMDEQREIIETLQHQNEKMKTELHENITNYFQQQLSNTIEMSGLANSSPEETTETVLKIAESVNVHLMKQEITSIRRLKNGKTSVTINEREKCNDLISASFKKFITNPTKSPTKSTHNQHRVFISNALTTVNHRLYKQRRDLKTEGTIDRISFFNGIFSVHKPG